MDKPKKKLSYRAKYKLLMGGSILTTITPLLVVMLINHKVYFVAKHKDTLYVGMILALLFMIIVVVKKLKLTKLMILGIIFALAIFFESMFKDVVMLTGALFGGAVLDRIVFYSKLKRYEKLIDYKDQADVQKETNKELIEEIIEVVDRGRV